VKIIWLNSTLSGLCDRFIDLFLMVAMAKIMKSDLTVLWKINSSFTEHQLRTWGKARFEDYKHEIFLQYFEMPSNLKLVSEKDLENLSPQDYVIFNDYIGGVLTPQEFYSRYLRDLCSMHEFESAYRQSLSEFKPKQKLLDLLSFNDEIDVAIHLRRGDKVNNNPNVVEIANDELENLDRMTMSCVDKLLSDVKNPSIFICSDDSSSIESYRARYSQKDCRLISVGPNVTDIEKTYVDLFLMTQSKAIVMSQKHSNFSLFASQVKSRKLVYFYRDNSMIVRNKAVNAIFHEDLE